MGLDNPWPLAVKAAAASMLAYGLCAVLGLQDGLSAAFVAVVCVTPTVLAGLRRALGQGLGSLIGGTLAAALMTLGLPTTLSLGLSVGGAMLAVFALGFSRAHTVAAFTAIYIHLLPLGGPGTTLWVRISAVGIGALAAMVVNAIVSSMFYERIFARRMQRVVEAVASGTSRIAAGDLEAMAPAFEALGVLLSELAQAERELQWRQNAPLFNAVKTRRSRVQALQRVAHFAHDLGVTVNEAQSTLTAVDLALLRSVSESLRGRKTEPPAGVGEVGQRLVAALQRFDRLAG